jgi:hypothetical protein
MATDCSIFLDTTASRPVSSSFKLLPGALLLKRKEPEHEGDHSPSYGVEIMYGVLCPFSICAYSSMLKNGNDLLLL